MHLSCFPRDYYVFGRSDILSLSKFRGSFSTGLLIEHAVPTYPRFVVFWVDPFPWGKRFARLKDTLESLGYDVRG